MKKTELRKYAELLVRVGVNLQKKQHLVISAPVAARDLVVEVVRIAYRAGASNVEVIWNDDEIARFGYKYRSAKQLGEVPLWIKQRYDHYLGEKIAYLVIIADDPEALKGIDPNKVAVARRARNKAIASFRDATSSNAIRWCIAGFPSRQWAKKMFPGLPAGKATDKLWQYISKTVRLDAEDPVGAWKEHQEKLSVRCKALNEAKIKRFTYRNSIGTDFTVCMPEGYKFCGGAEQGSEDGVYFTANMPTEEIFSSPDRNTANGKLVAAMPLCRNGQIIRGFWLRFENGRIVDFGAEEGYENLKSIIETDEGSHYLGEIAMVGYNSPIRCLDALFYETLYDENASCHFAIGDCYPSCVEGGEKMSEEQLKEKGLNSSLEHVDFMVGTADLSIVAETVDGKKIVVFKDGDWAI